MGEIAATREKTTTAVELLTRAVSVADNGPIRSGAQTKIGDIYASLLDFEKAADAYAEVAKFSPDVYGLYSSQLQAAIARRKAKQFDVSIEILRQLHGDYRFMDFWSTIRFELGVTYAESGRLMEAVDQYRLVDTTYARTEQGAKAAFEMGKLFQLQLGDYAEAKTAFSHASAGGPPEVTQEAQRRSGALEKYFRLSSQFMKLDSVYFILDIDSLWMQVDSSALTATPDTVRTSSDTLSGRVGEPRVGVADSSVVPKRDTVSVAAGSRELPIIIVKPKKDSILAAMKTASFQLGELFYTDLEAPDSTFLWLNQALKLGLDSAKSARALFVLAEVARENSQKKFGDEKELYRKIIERYPNSTYAEEAGIWLGMPPKPKNVDPANAVFVAAESLMTAKRFSQALDSLSRIVKDYPTSPLAPKSHYTMAWIYEHDLSIPDSALSQFKLLAAKHASTPYGAEAARRIPPAVVDSSKNATIGPARMGVDTTAQHQGPKVVPPGVDTLKSGLKPALALPDSLKQREEMDELKQLQKMPRDSSATRRARKAVIEE
jgi:tetratricopeptide (TPR) repeat protein